MSGQAPFPPRSRGSIDELASVFDDAKTYYGADERHTNTRAGNRTRTYSQVIAQNLAWLGLYIQKQDC